MRSNADYGPPKPLSIHAPIFWRLFGLLKPYWAIITMAMVLLIISMPCELFPAFIWKYVTDDLVLKGISRPSSELLRGAISLDGRLHATYALLLSALGWLVFIYAVGELTGTLSTVLLQRMAQKFVFTLRNQVYARLQGQSLGYLQLQRTGDLMSRAIGDVDEIQSFVVNSIDQIIGDGGLWVTTVIVVMWEDWRVALPSLLPMVAVLGMLVVFNRKVRPIYTAARARAGDVNTRLQENLSGVTVIKIFGREQEEARRFEQATWAYYLQQIKAITARNLYFPFTRAVGFLSNVLMIGIGGYLILKDPHGRFSIGTLLMFRAYWWRLFGPVQTLARVDDLLQRGGAAGRRVFEVLDAPDELRDAPDATPAGKIRGLMRLADVSFHYPADAGQKRPVVLENVNLHIEPGQTVAL
jgi:ATP-binding cassette, subfamily B, bacterial